MPNRFQVKRTTTSGLLPNVSNSSNTSYIAAGELAINLTDRKLLSSNGSATFEIGANLTSISVGGALTGNSTGLFFTSAAPQISLNNVTSNWITFSTNGVGAPTTTTRSAGTKLALYPSLNASQVDYAIGIESNHMWFSTDNATTGVKFYANTTNYMTANVAGLTVSGVVSADYYTAANNGNGTSYKVGDDAWIGDINVADTVGLKGQQNANYGYIKFGTAPTSLGYNGTSLVYSSNTSFGNTSVTGFINVSSTGQFGGAVRIANDQRLIFTANSTNPTHSSRLVHQVDDNFVFYVSSTTGTERAIWSVFSNSNTSALTVATAITATGDITAFFSDDRLKDRYSNIPNAIEKVKSLNGFYYEPNITAQDLGYQKEMHVGVSAQEVNAIMPEVVAPAPIDNKYMTVKYERLIPLLIEAIKEQQIQIDELKAQLNKD